MKIFHFSLTFLHLHLACHLHYFTAVLFPEGQCDDSTMKCARCLLQLQCLVSWSARSAAQYGALLKPASSGQPNLLHNTQHQVSFSLHT